MSSSLATLYGTITNWGGKAFAGYEAAGSVEERPVEKLENSAAITTLARVLTVPVQGYIVNKPELFEWIGNASYSLGIMGAGAYNFAKGEFVKAGVQGAAGAALFAILAALPAEEANLLSRVYHTGQLSLLFLRRAVADKSLRNLMLGAGSLVWTLSDFVSYLKMKESPGKIS